MKTTIVEHIENPNPELVEKVKEFQNRKEQGLKELEKEINDKGKLQNNFTTVGQSKRLLELGLPADSADCYLQNESQDPLAYVNYMVHIIQPFHDKRIMFSQLEDFLPCWSVGRLMEIFEICTGLVWQNEVIDGYTKLDMLLEDFEDVENKYHLDFSKLKE